jgi:hypothetical protein
MADGIRPHLLLFAETLTEKARGAAGPASCPGRHPSSHRPLPKVKQVHHAYDNCSGPIEGLRLPLRAWAVLRRENIMTLNRLKAVAHRIEQFTSVGVKTAQVIRAELARVALLEEQPPNPQQHRGAA